MVSTHRGEELRAAAHLERQSFRYYLPMCELERGTSEKGRYRVRVPLFDSYLFVKIRNQWQTVRNTRGVLRILMDGEQPARVPDRVIADIRSRENKRGFVDLVEDPPPMDRLTPGQAIRVQDGPLAGHGGVYLGMDGQRRVRALLTLLSRKVRVNLEREIVAAA